MGKLHAPSQGHRGHALDVNADSISFCAGWNAKAGVSAVDLDLSCVAFDQEGSMIDAVYYGCLTSLSGGYIRHTGDDRSGDGDDDDDDEVILINLKEAPSHAYAMVFTVGSFGDTTMANTDDIFFRILGNERAPLFSMSVQSQCQLPDMRSVILGVLHRVAGEESRWAFRVSAIAQAQNAWGLMLPALKEELRPVLPNITVDPSEVIHVVSKGEDLALDALIAPPTERRGLGFTLGAPPRVTRLRADLGWWLIQAPVEEEGEEEPEPPNMDVTVVMMDAEGETIGTVNKGNPEAEGIRLGSEDADAGEGEVDEDGEPIPKKPAAPVSRQEKLKFLVNETLTVNVAQLPPEVRCLFVIVTHFGEAGLEPVQTAYLRLMDISTETESEMAAYSVDVRGARMLQRQGGSDSSGLVMCKLYREPEASLYTHWQVDAGDRGFDEYVRSIQEIPRLDVVAPFLKKPPPPPPTEDGEEPVIPPPPTYMRARFLAMFLEGGGPDAYTEALQEAAIYDGNVDHESNRCDTKARVKLPSGDFYLGSYARGRRNGNGIYVFANGSLYAGGFYRGKRHGTGTLWTPDGAKYTGEFQADKMHGHGIYYYPSGDRYEGGWLEGKKHGNGKYIYSAGGDLTGTWKNGVQDGPASYTERSFGKFEGNYTNGIPDGNTTFHFARNGLILGGKYSTPPPGEDEDPDEVQKPTAPEWKGLHWAGLHLSQTPEDY